MFLHMEVKEKDKDPKGLLVIEQEIPTTKQIEVEKPIGLCKTVKVMETIETTVLQKLVDIPIEIFLPKEGKLFRHVKSKLSYILELKYL